MAHYLSLSKYRYNERGHGTKSSSEIDDEYRRRLEGPSTVVTNLLPTLTTKEQLELSAVSGRTVGTRNHPIFFVETRTINRLVERVRLLSNQILDMTHGHKLPPVAVQSFVYTLMTNEIVFTNEIEGVKTNPVEIGTMVGGGDTNSNSSRRLRSTVHKYQDVLKGKVWRIDKLADFRTLYDELLKGEIAKDNLPDGQLFRNRFVSIGDGVRVVHTPPDNEDNVRIALQQLVAFMNDDSLVQVEKALVTHFMFENTHPFNDGNGRTGRYLLSSYLSSKLDPYTGLSISTSIHSNLNKYYRLFQDADDVANRGELTFFVEGLLQIIVNGQKDVIDQLNSRASQLSAEKERLWQKLPDLTVVQKNVVYVLLQSRLFTNDNSYGVQDRELYNVVHDDKGKVASRHQIKDAIDALEEQNVIITIKKRPLQHVLADRLFMG
ncbi:Fic family protein [Lacticaseibacillus pantheris]|jgi:Fic family protein|uniref:Fic family protein n=1 Tax=Lacticaseibacillus pantheris TaxID=171523 RepID=UPI00265AA451|nr:Fic family protein [Lacticaseibacillus pantheris]WKF84140.1 Fic family protein [Lacticaseibacillus pantheris]